ncbi:hypothetical protein DSM25558_5371 [Agrobacterium sp. DSM 25558]|uniref:hypothetical protein n=1 Tax=Agrobacterium sp. DSM 25558 TaxID=1907665 RepID=UPI000972637F|nr:hypothetical protein [Agrobacterium sp. DSM 25558]SCX32054.1 hypothetical protein DSM25558_5371 [Agrobacterium sp. DSM 25558]
MWSGLASSRLVAANSASASQVSYSPSDGGLDQKPDRDCRDNAKSDDLPHRPRVSDIWKLYLQHNEAGLTGMSPNQMRKHKISRERAIRYFNDFIGDRELHSIDRADTIRFRDWWVRKIKDEKLKASSANRSFADIAGMHDIIDDGLHTQFHKAWEKIRIKETNATNLDKRPPFPLHGSKKKILAPGALDGLNAEGKAIIIP